MLVGNFTCRYLFEDGCCKNVVKWEDVLIDLSENTLVFERVYVYVCLIVGEMLSHVFRPC